MHFHIHPNCEFSSIHSNFVPTMRKTLLGRIHPRTLYTQSSPPLTVLHFTLQLYEKKQKKTDSLLFASSFSYSMYALRSVYEALNELLSGECVLIHCWAVTVVQQCGENNCALNSPQPTVIYLLLQCHCIVVVYLLCWFLTLSVYLCLSAISEKSSAINSLSPWLV